MKERLFPSFWWYTGHQKETRALERKWWALFAKPRNRRNGGKLQAPGKLWERHLLGEGLEGAQGLKLRLLRQRIAPSEIQSTQCHGAEVPWCPGEESTCQRRRRKIPGFDPWVGKIPWKRNGNPLQGSCLGNSMDRGAWWTTVHGVAKSQTRLSNWTHTHTHDLRISGDWQMRMLKAELPKANSRSNMYLDYLLNFQKFHPYSTAPNVFRNCPLYIYFLGC